jgi:hypothetical protein
LDCVGAHRRAFCFLPWPCASRQRPLRVQPPSDAGRICPGGPFRSPGVAVL